jgi:hypothetical protein
MDAKTTELARILSILASGVIPEDEVDRGAAEANAGAVLAGRIESGINSSLYLRGIESAASLAKERFGGSLDSLNSEQLNGVLMELKSAIPGFYKQLRADVCALYLSEPAVWQRIGFPGPSTHLGGYPDFDQPQFLYQKK